MPIKLKELKNMLNSLAARLKDIGFKFPFNKIFKTADVSVFDKCNSFKVRPLSLKCSIFVT